MSRHLSLFVWIFLSAGTLCIVLASSTLAQATSSAPTQTTSSFRSMKRPSKHSALPIVGEFETQKNESPQERQHRELREARYGNQLPKPLGDPGKAVSGQTRTARLTFIDYVKPGVPDSQMGIPLDESTAIVIGTVSSGKCFINSANTFVYTDYRVKIDRVLKPDLGRNLQEGDAITATRPGGSIHFPSGHITDVFNVGHGLPEIGAQYILFLWRAISEFDDYEIIIDSGYELKDGRVYALDDANTRLDGQDAAKFIDKIKAMLSQGGSK